LVLRVHWLQYERQLGRPSLLGPHQPGPTGDGREGEELEEEEGLLPSNDWEVL